MFDRNRLLLKRFHSGTVVRYTRRVPILAPTPPERMLDAKGRPYFLWDEDITLDVFRARLTDPEVRAYDLGKLMRQVKPDDGFTFVTLCEIRGCSRSWFATSAAPASSGSGCSINGRIAPVPPGRLTALHERRLVVPSMRSRPGRERCTHRQPKVR